VSLLLELPEVGVKSAKAAHVRDVSSSADSFVIDVGPVAASAVAPLNRTADSSLPNVSRVTLQASSNANGQIFARLRVELRNRCQHSIRVSNQRIYIDISPVAAAAAHSEVAASPAAKVQAPPVATPPTTAKGAVPTSSPTATTTATATSSPAVTNVPAVTTSAGSLDPATQTAYESLQADARRRAPALARKPDVNGLIALIAEIRRRDDRLGHKRADLIEPLIAEMNQALEEARALRLKLDAIELKKKQGETR
jgi:hypothetical protein